MQVMPPAQQARATGLGIDAPMCSIERYKEGDGVPTGIRTPVAAVKGRCPRPLDDGDAEAASLLRYFSFAAVLLGRTFRLGPAVGAVQKGRYNSVKNQ